MRPHTRNHGAGGRPFLTKCIISDITNKTRKIKNNIFAIPTAAAKTPVNPNNPAIIAIIKNTKTHPNMAFLLNDDSYF
jgi:hypothetical protein